MLRVPSLTIAVVLLSGGAWAQRDAPNPLPWGVEDVSPPAPRDPASEAAAEPSPAPVTPSSKAPTTPTTTPPTTTPPTTTRAVREPFRLIFAPGGYASSCPTPADVAALVSRHLGYDPFGEPATRVVLLALDGEGPVPARARVELLDLALQPSGSRVVEASDGCAELVAVAALQMAIAIDPLSSSSSSSVSSSPSPTGPVDPAGPSAPPPPTAPTTPPADGAVDVAPPAGPPPAAGPPVVVDDIEVFYTGGMHVGALLAPEGAMLGLSVGIGGRLQAVSARVEGRFDFSGDDSVGTSSFPIIASVVPCAHLPMLDLGEDGELELTGCLTASLGVMPAVGVYTGFGVYAGSGARVAVDWRFADEITLRLFGQLEAAALRPTLVALSSGNIYQSPGFNMVAGFAMDLPDF